MATATKVYGVSVDSRNRPAGTPEHKYTISLGRTLDRVKSVQLASIQIPDCRQAFGPTAQFQYSEPITIPADTRLDIEEVTTVTTTGAAPSTTSSSRIVSVLVPPTLNEITAFADPVTTTTSLTGLEFGVNYYPLIGQRMQVVGGHFPQTLLTVPMPAPFPTVAGPVLTTDTTVAPYVGVTSALGTEFDYAAGYITALVGDTVASRHVAAYVHAPRPTLVELFTMINAALRDRTAATDLTGTVVNATNAIPIVVTSGAAHGLVTGDQVVVSGVGGNLAANGTFRVTVTTATTFELDGSAGSGGYLAGGTWTSPQRLNTLVQLGFDDTTNQIIATAPRRVTESGGVTTTVEIIMSGSLATLVGFAAFNRLDPPAVAAVPTSILRTVAISQGNYTAPQLAATVAIQMNALDLTSADSTTRVLPMVLPGGTSAPVTVARGRYTGPQLATYLTSVLSTPPYDVSVTYNATTGRFTFTHDLGLVFGLEWETSPALALQLGFDAITYDGAASYTSVKRAVYGVAADATFPLNTYALAADTINQHFLFETNDPVVLVANGQTAPTEWNVSFVDTGDGAATPWAAGEVLFARRPFHSGSDITDASNASPIVITTTAAHGLTTGDSVTVAQVTGNTAANGTFTVTVTGGTTFELNGSTGSGAYVSGGIYWSNSSGGGVTSTNVYTVVVENAWSGTTPLDVDLQPTPSVVSALDAGTVDQALGTPAADNLILLQSARRNVFQLHFAAPESCADNFGFPALAWPPSVQALQTFDATSLPTYDAATRSVPVASSYVSPYCYNLLPPDYIIMLLTNPCGARDIHTHAWRDRTYDIFAKLHFTAPFLSISEQMQYSTFASFERINEVGVEFQNPDGTPVVFNGRSYTFSLIFTLAENSAEGLCF